MEPVETHHSYTQCDVKATDSKDGAGEYIGYNKVQLESVNPNEDYMNENLIPAYNVVVKEESISHVESDVGNSCSPVYNVRVSSDVALGSVSTVSCVPVDGSLNNTYVSINSTLPESFIPVNSVDGQNLFPVKHEVLQNDASVSDMAMDKEVCPMDVKITLDKVSVETTSSRQRKHKVTAATAPSRSKKSKVSAGIAPTKSRKKKAPVVTPHTVTLKSASFASLQSLLKGVDAKGFSLIQTKKQIQFIQLYRTETPSIKLSVCIDEYFNCSVSVHRQPVDRSHSIWKDLPDKLDDVSSVMELLDRINKLKVCCGSLQEKYHELVNIGGFLTNKSETDTITIVGFREGDFGAITPDGLSYLSTIRSTKCSLFIDRDVKAVSIRCKECTKLNDYVRRRCKVLREQKNKSTIFVPSSVEYKDMTRDELYKTMDEHRAEINYLQSTMNRLNILYEKALKCLRDGSQLQPTDQQAVSDLDDDLDTSTPVPESSNTTLNSGTMEEPSAQPSQQSQASTNDTLCARTSTLVTPKQDHVDKTQNNSVRESTAFNILDSDARENSETMDGKSSQNSPKHKSSTSGYQYHCVPCVKSFSTPGQLAHHRKMHSRNDKKPNTVTIAFSCELCEETFMYASLLATHKKKHHSGKTQHTCTVCGQTCINLNRHMVKHKKKDPREKTQCKCETCGKSFTQRKSLKEHVRVLHGDEEPQYKCTVCERSFHRSDNFRAHMKIHADEKPHVCEVCGKSFIRKTSLISHARLHTGEKPYICTVCGTSFSSESNLNRHTRAVHLQEKGHVCGVCGKCFRDRGQLDNHQRLKHSDETPFHCTLCNKQFKIKAYLNIHMDRHTYTVDERKCICSICGKQFSQSGALTIHMRTHTGEKPYICDVCNKAFHCIGILNAHKKVHTGEKHDKKTVRKYDKKPCTLCGKSFSATNLNRHIRYVHMGESKHVCTYCEKRCRDSSNLRDHMRTHTGEKPYNCTVCNKKFVNQWELNRHTKTVH